MQKNKLGKKWFFDTGNMRGSQRFGDYFRVSHVVATLLNKAFVLKEGEYIETEEYFESNNHLIEKAVVKSTATPRTKRYKKQEKIIFPYYFDNSTLKRYTEAEFEKYYPGATAYLKEFRKELDSRQSDNNAKWFEYGRSQALSNMNNEKLLISTVVTDTIESYLLEESCVPYAGMYIIIKNGQTKYSLDKAKEILCSARFYQYVKTVFDHLSGVFFFKNLYNQKFSFDFSPKTLMTQTDFSSGFPSLKNNKTKIILKGNNKYFTPINRKKPETYKTIVNRIEPYLIKKFKE